MTLLHMTPGSRFQVRDMPELTGTLLSVSEARATVRLDAAPEYVHYVTEAGKVVEFYRQPKKTEWTSRLEVIPLR